MSILEKLLAPYAAATSGQATPLDYLKQDPVYATLFPTTVPGGGSRSRGGAAPPVANGLIGLAKQIERMGFDVGELEGWEEDKQISSGHSDNSYHYRGRALDANYYGDGRWKNEGQALDFLERWLRKRYDPTELLWRTDDHYDHLHFAL